ncbi:glycerol-3-phosphate dehydrogenase/oxidase [Corynebacterium anserum]|uniref:FAD-dependent oxidoreductase n=1 Tax=Corynebacterium anserum TaxID=2684406 RepID=A0A7G7YPX1_9CORY|nr:glycerol-3-phosphate dehydrogenase/oxidase [Corynebacterium anserum]QNH96541.1 FAD-dependent oxidoreductase [Corynebacterium anserum]
MYMNTTKEFTPENTILSPDYRSGLLKRLNSKSSYDLVIVGAGVTGSGVALDAASRGLKVLLVDAVDLAFGTSRWSSKLAHGGLRYLASGNVGIAQRSAVERGILMEHTAPHLTRALPQVVAVQNYNPLSLIPRAGFIAGDLLRKAAGTSAKTLPRSRTISAHKVRQFCPSVADHIKFGFVNYDGQLIDDARLVTALARTAAGYGADILTHARADVSRGRDDEGMKSVTITLDKGLPEKATVPGGTIQVKAAGVINATGVWAGGLEKEVTVTPSRGTHVVVDSKKLGNPTGALTVAVPGSINRFCFILPVQLGRCYIGLTDEKADLEDVPHAPEEDIRWILNVVNRALRVSLTNDDVLAAFAGLRPLVQIRNNNAQGENGPTADLSREHLILNNDGLITVTGGKLTEYRLMAEQTVDEALRDAKIRAKIRDVAAPCSTKKIPLVGASLAVSPGICQKMAANRAHTFASMPHSMIQRYGDEAINVLHACSIPDGDKTIGNLDITRAELAYTVTHEGAVTIDDILDRRTRIGLVPGDREEAESTAQEALKAVGL